MATELALMLGLVYLVSALFFGWSLVLCLRINLLRIEAAALAVTFGLLGWAWLSFLLALVLPMDWASLATIIVTGSIGFILFRRSHSIQWRTLPGGRRAGWWVGGFTAVVGVVLGWLFWTHDLLAQNGAIYSGGSTWADFGVHASLISHFAAATHLPMDLPVAAGAHLTYPFLIDLLSAWLVRGGLSLQLAIAIPSILLVLAFTLLVIGFTARVLKSISGAILGLTLTLLNGSAVAVAAAYSDWQHSGLSLGSFLRHIPLDYTSIDTYNAHLTNLITDIILPQRAFLFGLAAFGAVLVLLASYEERSHRALPYIIGIIAGLLPFAHPHTFIAVGFLLGAFLIRNWIRHRRPWSPWLGGGLVAMTLATPQILWQSLANGNGTGGHWAVGWMVNPGESIFAFWGHNYGLAGLGLATLFAATILYRPWRRYAIWLMPMAALLVVANLYSPQPFAFDNVKLITYVYLMGAIIGSGLILQLIHCHRWVVAPMAVASLVLISSGLLVVIREFELHDEFASADDVALASWVDSSTNPSDVFITTDKPNQPIPTLAGRSIVLGYRGWLYSYHLPYAERESVVRDALAGVVTRPELDSYRVGYLAVATNEPAEWPVARSKLTEQYRVSYQNASWTVYRLR